MSSDTSAMMDRLDDAVAVSKEMNPEGAQTDAGKAAADMLKGLRH